MHVMFVLYLIGSGQQSVTGVDTADDANSYWRIRGKPSEICQRGSPIKCGQAVRFTHMKTGRNLHSHHFSSPLSNNQVICMEFDLIMFSPMHSVCPKNKQSLNQSRVVSFPCYL